MVTAKDGDIHLGKIGEICVKIVKFEWLNHVKSHF
jgi:hypothetical protein